MTSPLCLRMGTMVTRDVPPSKNERKKHILQPIIFVDMFWFFCWALCPRFWIFGSHVSSWGEDLQRTDGSERLPTKSIEGLQVLETPSM